MVFMVRLISGALFILLYTSNASTAQNGSLKIENQSNRNKTDGFRSFSDRDVENIVKPLKFAKENAENTTTLKLKQSESYTTKRTENLRTGSGRSVDIDIEKYISPDFYNAVYTLPISTHTKKYTSEDSFENIAQLTTPKTPYFDGKFKETVDSVNQKLEVESLENDFDNFTQTTNYTSDNLIEESEKNPNVTKFEYKNYENIELNETKRLNGERKDSMKETQTVLNFESRRNRTEIYNDFKKENVKYLLGKENSNEVKREESTDGTNSHFTTKYSITKPPTDKSDIISNKIESGTSKDTLETTTTRSRGSIKFADYRKLNIPSNKNKTLEQTVQENQIVPVQVTAPSTILETTNSAKRSLEKSVDATTTPSESIDTVEPEEQQSTTILVILQPNDSKYETTTGFGTKTTIASTPRGFRTTTTTTTTTEEYEFNTETTESEREKTTTEVEDETTETTAIETTTPEKTTEETTQETTTQETTTQEITTLETTTDNEITTITEFDTTTLVSTIDQNQKDEKTAKTINFTKTEPRTTEPMITTTTTELSKVTTTSEASVGILTTPTKTLLENHTQENLTTENVKIQTTEINFVHIRTVDKNHTTLLPDILRPNEVYTTPSVLSTETKTSTIVETSTDEGAHSTSDLEGPGGGNGAIVAIVISCVGGICLIVLACLLIVMRNRQKRFNYGQRCRPVSLDDYSVDNVSVFNSVRRKAAARSSKRSYGNPAFEDPVCLSHPLHFPAISKFAANAEDVHAEFSEIPQIIARTSELPEGCETKNRYANVIPLPESRVFLNHVEGYPNSDYINANFVTGPKNTRKYYIACQAPMSNTVDDFWRMIWEHQCKVVLMLTHLFENGIEKCYDYLPPSEVLDCHRLFGDFQVTLKKREVKEKYIISSLQLRNMVSNSWREVTHFWYMGWPEKGVPTEANSIIAFLIEARSFMKIATIDKKTSNGNMNGGLTDINPVVVHCSPGTGRTGVVITCDIAIREFEQTRQVDIPKILYKIRRDRAGAVQTKDQYAFIYKVVDLYATKLAGGGLESI